MNYPYPPSFEIRSGESIVLDDVFPEYFLGMFPIPLPGPMGNVTGTNKPATAYRMSLAQVRPDGKLRWMVCGVATHAMLSQAMDDTGLGTDKWYGIRIEKMEMP